jgi:uncharacterized protein (DUF1800 family)
VAQILEVVMKLVVACSLILSIAVPSHAASPQAAPIPPLTEQQKIVHALNRLGYGPRPGDVERVAAVGLDQYIRQQFHPESIPDDAVEKKLAAFSTLTMTSAQMAAAYREEKEEQRRIQQERAKAQAADEAMKQADGASPPPAKPASKPMRQEIMARSEQISVRAVAELQNEKIIRAIASERQFQEVLVDFWSNHFNIDIRKSTCRVLKPIDERDVIRAHVFGKFRELLEASAKSPAMLVYLDNAQNSAPRTVRPRKDSDPSKPETRGGLNENYAREIMELHTLGVDGGYTQQDVIEVARCFTGWTVDPREGAFVFTPRRHDDGNKTVLGHTIAANGGIKDGEQVLDILCRHPSTATFIATKLCRRLVSDDPPAPLVERVAKVFRETDGDLRQVYETIIFSPEFFSPTAYRAKIKSPFEFAVSAARATGTPIEPEAGRVPAQLRMMAETSATFERGGNRANRFPRKSLNFHIIRMGQPLFAYQAPTGYPEDSRKWVSTGALIDRLNFALAFTSHGILDADFQPNRILGDADIDQPNAVIDRLAKILLQGEISDTTRAVMTKQTGTDDAATVNAAKLTALILGSPEFQRR